MQLLRPAASSMQQHSSAAYPELPLLIWVRAVPSGLNKHLFGAAARRLWLWRPMILCTLPLCMCWMLEQGVGADIDCLIMWDADV